MRGRSFSWWVLANRGRGVGHRGLLLFFLFFFLSSESLQVGRRWCFWRRASVLGRNHVVTET